MSTEQQNTTLPEASMQQATTEEIEQSQESIAQGGKLQRINDILEGLDLPEAQEDEYRQNFLKLSSHTLDQALAKDSKELLPFLIQAQINELEAKGLENLSDEEFIQYSKLTDTLIAVEKAETTHNENLIANEQAETADIQKTNQKLDELRGILLSNNSLSENPHIEEIRSLFDQIDGNRDMSQEGKLAILKRITDTLKSPGTLESIAESLGGTHTQEYQTLKTQLLTIEPSLQDSFDRVEMNLLSSLAQTKLGRDNLDGVKLDQNTLIKNEGNMLIEIGDADRNISLTDSEYKLSSNLNPDYEASINRLHQQASKELQPIHEKQGALRNMLNLISQADKNGTTLDTVKTQIQAQYPTLYSELGTSGHMSLNAISTAIMNKLNQLEEQQATIHDRTKGKIDAVVSISTKEAQEKDRYKKHMLEFLHSIGFDIFSQEKTNTIIEYINLNPQQYSLQNKIDFENSELGFNHDFGNKELATTEKQGFIQLFNRMLGEPIIDENIAKKTTSLSPEAIMRLQVLNNKTVGYFLGNLDQNKKGR